MASVGGSQVKLGILRLVGQGRYSERERNCFCRLIGIVQACGFYQGRERGES